MSFVNGIFETRKGQIRRKLALKDNCLDHVQIIRDEKIQAHARGGQGHREQKKAIVDKETFLIAQTKNCSEDRGQDRYCEQRYRGGLRNISVLAWRGSNVWILPVKQFWEFCQQCMKKSFPSYLAMLHQHKEILEQASLGKASKEPLTADI